MHPDLIRIGSFALPSYGVALACAFLASIWLLRRRAPSFGVKRDDAADVAIWLLLSGLLGAKVLLLVVEGPRYLRSWGDFVEFLRSGGVFYGGLIGAVLALAIVLRKRHIGFWTFADMAAPAVALGHAIGRIGCFLAGCCWGRECSLPWAVTFTDPVAERNVGVPLNVPLHPTQLYEALGNVVILGLLLKFEKRRWKGQTFAWYLGAYAILRGTLEFFRGDPRGSVLDGAVSTSQLIAVAGLAAAVGISWWNRGQPADSSA
ncbi:MAG TPA: prolipoprotein diacylglyceryl transferase [Thermoanaerobaculia bacterium]|nr:prolipoprotein diacylglyceryl transferase [Thermoanaerobaculia bacterium]